MAGDNIGVVCLLLTSLIHKSLGVGIDSNDAKHLTSNGMPVLPRDGIHSVLSERLRKTLGSTIDPQPLPIESSCTAFINHFSEAAAEFTKCSITFSRPLRFCENCVDEYLLAMESYELIMKGTASDFTGELCSDIIMNSDRIQIIEQTFTFMQGIWNQCYCDACFFGFNYNTTNPELNNSTVEFMNKVNETWTCFENYTHGKYMPVEPFIKTNGSVNPEICDSCREMYRDLNKFYEELSEERHGKICMDVVDIMNSTRLLWSKEFHCTRHEVDIVPVVLLSIFFCSLPVLFYVANKIHGTKTEKKLLKQKRLRESQMTTPVQHTQDD